MRYLTNAKGRNYKLIEEVRYALIPEAERAGEKDLKLKAVTPERGAREPSDTHLMNWVLARFFAMPRAQRDRFIVEGKTITDTHLAMDEWKPIEEDWPFDPDAGPDGVSVGGGLEVGQEVPPPPDPAADCGRDPKKGDHPRRRRLRRQDVQA